MKLQATLSEGLAQGPYIAARAGFEPVTLRTYGTELTIEPPRPPYISLFPAHVFSFSYRLLFRILISVIMFHAFFSMSPGLLDISPSFGAVLYAEFLSAGLL